MPQTYFEDFDDGPGGWLLWLGGGGGPLPTDIREGALVSRSPWGVDFNHAPPGAGYLHLLYVLPTRPRAAAWDARLEPFGGAPRFIQGDFPRDFTHARIAVRVRGEIDLKGSHMLLLIQGDVGPVRTNWVLHAQPVVVTREWSEQTLALEPDERQWTCLGARASGADCSAYGRAPLADCLRNVNVNIIFVLFPLDVRPFARLEGDPHALRAGKDYVINRLFLPTGEVGMDWARIEFAAGR